MTGHSGISVIVPVYGAERTLEECVDSMLAQPCPELEVILVDDGSPDRCPAICDAYAAADTRVRVIHQKNAGVSAARNAGLNAAAGRYIAFVDADDLLEPDILGLAYEAAEDGTMPVWGYTGFDGGREENCPHLCVPEMTPDQLQAAVIGCPPAGAELGTYFNAVWGKLFDTEIIRRNGLRFPEGQYIGEDLVFLLDYVPHVTHVVPVSDTGYRYRQLPSSAVRRYKPDLAEQYEIQAERIRNRVDPQDPDIRSAMAKFVYEVFCALIENADKAPAGTVLPDPPDAKAWIRRYSETLMRKDLNVTRMRKLFRVQYGAGVLLPYPVHAYLVRRLARQT